MQLFLRFFLSALLSLASARAVLVTSNTSVTVPTLQGYSYKVQALGTWGGATVTLQTYVDGAWLTLPGGAYTADFEEVIVAASRELRAQVTGTSGPTSLSITWAELQAGESPAGTGGGGGNYVPLSQLSTTGGANKVPQLNADGDWLTNNNFLNDGTQFGPGGNIFMPDMRGIQWYKRDGTKSGFRILPWELHEGQPGWGEFLIESPFRMALLTKGPIQVGVGDPLRFATTMQFNAGASSVGDQMRASNSIMFLTHGYNGGAQSSKWFGMQSVPNSAANTEGTLKFFSNAAVTGSTSPLGEVGGTKGDMTGVEVAEFTQAGISEPGKFPLFQTVAWATPTTTQTVSKHKSVQVGSLLMTGPTTLAFSGVLSGMRGSLYVYQDTVGSRVLTLPTGSIRVPGAVLSTTPNAIDRLQWEYDGANYYWTINRGLEITLDVAAQTYIDQNVAITSYGDKLIINNLVLSLKAASLWAKFDAIYPFFGGTAAANSQDLKSAYDITWSGSPIHNASGVTGDPASSAYGNTGVNLSVIGGRQNNTGFYIYSKTATPTDGGMWMGATSASSFARFGRRGGILKGDGPNSNSVDDLNWGINTGRFRGHFTMNRTSSNTNNFRFLEFGQPVATPTNSTTTTSAVNNNILILGSNNNGTPADFTNANLGFAAIGQSLTAGEWDAFFVIINTFQTAAGRAN